MNGDGFACLCPFWPCFSQYLFGSLLKPWMLLDVMVTWELRRTETASNGCGGEILAVVFGQKHKQQLCIFAILSHPTHGIWAFVLLTLIPTQSPDGSHQINNPTHWKDGPWENWEPLAQWVADSASNLKTRKIDSARRPTQQSKLGGWVASLSRVNSVKPERVRVSF